ncbi:D-amino-acid oxidase [Cryptococcus neoformans Tu401-1]|nr:D-amino-acid oxidase [Cryptococcus neoformans var. grubii Tu401-1]
MSFDAVVIGSGVIGLSIARELDKRGLKVAIVARDLAEDSISVGFASPWAGCNWFSFAEGGTPAAEWDAITFGKLAKLAEDHHDICEKIPFCSVWDLPKSDAESEPWFKDLVFDYKNLKSTPGQPLAGGKKFGHSFTSYVLHAPNYIRHLSSEIRARGIPIHRYRLSSLDEAYNLSGVGKVSLVINASGLGAKSLIGVEDQKVYPGRGQTVLVRAPGFKACIMHTEGFYADLDESGQEVIPPPPAYIIPRPGSEGHVVLGGVYQKDNWSTLPDLKEAERILKDCYNLAPELAGPNGKSWKDIEIISHNVGLRPARKGEPRLEIEEREVGAGANEGNAYDVAPMIGRIGERRKVAVVHAYGIGSAGFQASLGMAEKASDLAVKYLSGKRSPARL